MAPETASIAGMDRQLRVRKIRRVLLWILVANWAVAAAKVIVGLIADSAAVTADGFHSFIDGSSNIIGLVAVIAAAQPADEDHPYGHGKFEALASLAIGAMVGIGMLELGRMALDALIHDRHPEVSAQMVIVMVATLVVNLAVTTFERKQARELDSPLLLADATHTLSDVFVTLAVLVSLGFVSMGFERADGLVAIFVMFVIARVAYGIIRQAVGILSDTARLNPDHVSEIARQVPGVRDCMDIRSRGMENSVWVDLTIHVDPELTTRRAHAVAHEVERALAERYPQIVDIVVHVEPEPHGAALTPGSSRPSAEGLHSVERS